MINPASLAFDIDGVVADITGLSLMFLVLIIKPTGLFGTADRA